MNNAEKKRILVVDDEPRIGKVLSIKLNLSGFDVITTTSGAEAIELARTQEWDLILLDMLMPDISGMDVLDSIRTFSQVPIIVFTGLPEIAQSALKRGANDCIAKPFDPDGLIGKIESVLKASKTGKRFHEG